MKLFQKNKTGFATAEEAEKTEMEKAIDELKARCEANTKGGDLV